MSTDKPSDHARRDGPEFGSVLCWAIAEALADPERIEQLAAELDDDTGDPSKPEVIVNHRHLNEIADELVELLVEQNDPPTLFEHGGTVSLFERRQLTPLDHEALLDVLERRVRPVTVLQSGEHRPGRLAVDLRKVVLRRLLEHLPPLASLAPAPFMRPDGMICSKPGYDRSTELLLLDGVNLDVPDEPTEADVAGAVELIDELLADFPLPTLCARAHAFSALLTPAVRHLVALAPLHYFSANTAGVGKNLLSECLLYVHRGVRVPTDPLPTDEEEMRKQITSLLAAGARDALWDEAHLLIGRQLARLLTSATWRDRVLGANVTIEAQNLISAYALGNNGEIAGDLRRRVVRIDMLSPLAQPSQRTGFRHPDLRAWVAEHRGELLAAVLTMLRAWHVAGRPGVDAQFGSFEDWTTIVGGTLAVAGVEGFLDNVAEVLEEADHLDEEMAAHVAQLAAIFGESGFLIRDVLDKVGWPSHLLLPGGLRPHDLGAGEQLGKLYRRFRGRVWPSGHAIVKAGVTNGRTRWAINEPNPVRNRPASPGTVDLRGGDGGVGGDRQTSKR